MSKKLYDENNIQAIANAIRNKSGETTTYTTGEMAQAISEISTGIEPTGTKNITSNGNYDVTTYANANVNVNVDLNSYYSSAALSSTTMYMTFYAKTVEKTLPMRIKSYKNFEMLYAFYNFEKLKDISSLSELSISNVTSLGYAFENCKNLKNLEPLRNWDTSKVTNLSNIFHCLGVSNTTDEYQLDAIKNWDTSKVTNFYCAFNSIYSSNATWKTHLLDELELNWCFDKATDAGGMFTGASGSYTPFIKNKFSGLYTTENATTSDLIISQMFGSQKTLKIIDLSKVVRKISNMGSAFYGCTSLELLDIRGFTCSGITSSSYYSYALNNVPKTCKIIVKDDTEKTWWQTKFSAWSSCFYTPEEAIAAGIVDE